tara:strand:- start:9876 stop:10946 length:1071 start_codon:yes stop_codon:yes gene_type:complete
MSDKSTEKKAPNTHRSTAMAALPFYDNKIRMDTAYAKKIVDEVFGEELREEAFKNRLNKALDNPPPFGSLTDRMRESEHLRSKKDDMKYLDIDNLDKMEAAVARSNRARTPSEVGLDTADELLGLSQSSPALAKRIGDRSTPVPDFPSSVFDTPDRKKKSLRRSSSSQTIGGMSRAGTHEKLRKEQKLKFIELLEHTERWSDVNRRYNAYLRQDDSPDLLSDEDKQKMFNITEKAILDDMGARRGGGPTDRTLVVTQKEMKKNQAQKFYELLSTYITYKDADKAFQEYLKETNQPEMFGKKLRMEMFTNIERGIANEFDFDSHIVKDNIGGKKRTRRRKQTKRKRHLKKGTRKKTK